MPKTTSRKSYAGQWKTNPTREPCATAPSYPTGEKEILTSLVEGHTNKEIASIYNLSVHTVISHRKNISRKTGIKTVSGLTVYALLNNLVKADDVE